MAFTSIVPGLRTIMIVILLLVAFILIFFSYFQPIKFFPSFLSHNQPAKNCYPPMAHSVNLSKPLLLLWFWPENKMFDFQDCQKIFKIDSCNLTDDRSLYSRAQAVLLFHRAIKDDLSNLPTSPRARFQKWIWFNMDPPTKTRRIEGIQGMFNLTMSYRSDADIHVRWKVTRRNNQEKEFVLPKKERLLCWIVDNSDLDTKSGQRYDYYRELVKHIKVDVFNGTSDEFSKGENYFQTISSCKFYLSFEDSIHKDYITETFNGPLAAGTVPVVLGPSRQNYEDFAPGSSFIHVNDFPEAAKLAEFLLKLDKDNKAYMRYFDWRQFYTARRHLMEKHEFALAICQACYHVDLHRVYRVVPDVYKWFFP